MYPEDRHIQQGQEKINETRIGNIVAEGDPDKFRNMRDSNYFTCWP